MRSLIFLALLAGVCVWLVAARPAGSGNAGSNVVWTSNDEGPGSDCREHLRGSGFNLSATVRGEETQRVPNQPLMITGERNGGIRVTTWDQPDFSITLCKQASAENEADARRIVDKTRLNIRGAEVSVSAPDSGDRHSLGTLLMIQAPRGATVDLRVQNGGVAVNRFIGAVEARARNGGISFKNSSGKLTAEAENGGIAIQDCDGEIAANVENGGLSITLPDHWEGKGLQAHTQNGGLVLAIPRDFGGGVEIEGSEYAAIVCPGSVCDGAERTSGHGRRTLHLGGSGARIHASTVNGGIVIRERRGEL